jgi:hypothetical protein
VVMLFDQESASSLLSGYWMYRPLVLNSLGLGHGSRVRGADARAIAASLFDWLSHDDCKSHGGEDGVDELHLVWQWFVWLGRRS